MTGQDKWDIAILVPKQEELTALEWAFDTQFRKSYGSLGETTYYKLIIPGPPEILTAVVLLNDQTNEVSSLVTQQVVYELDPPLIFLLGTAAGREGAVSIGSVVASKLIVDATEWRVEDDADIRIRHHKPPERIRVEVGRFIDQDALVDRWRDKAVAVRKMHLRGRKASETSGAFWRDAKLEMAFIGSSNSMNLSPTVLGRLWDVDNRVWCYEMEAAGFGLACQKEIGLQWLVVRGISDYGYPKSKSDENRRSAALSAAVFLRMFIEGGLEDCHPSSLRVPESDKSELSSDNFYAQLDVTSIVTQGLKAGLDIDLTGIDLGKSLTLGDYESLCVARGADPAKARNALCDIREDYFTEKYVDYTYDNDLRGLIPNWPNEIADIISHLSVDLSACTVLDVGIGNGLEAPSLFKDTANLIAVDISEKSLLKAKISFPTLKSVHNAAENMLDIETGSVDVYISLRTYQASLFDISLALREAQRVLRSTGVIVVSVANGFVDLDNNVKKVVRGLLIPGSRRIVDKNTPRRIADQIVEKLTDLGFENVGYSSGKTDIYVWGRRP